MSGFERVWQKANINGETTNSGYLEEFYEGSKGRFEWSNPIGELLWLRLLIKLMLGQILKKVSEYSVSQFSVWGFKAAYQSEPIVTVKRRNLSLCDCELSHKAKRLQEWILKH